MLKRAVSSACILLFALLSVLIFRASAAALTADIVGDYGDIVVMEVEGDYDALFESGAPNSAPRETIARQFYTSHADEYDFIFIFTNFDFQMPSAESVAFYHEVRNEVLGIGLNLFDYSSFFGSNSKLQGVIDMGNLANLASDPLDPDFSFTLGLISHELMHRWGCYIRIQAENPAQDLLGSDGDHWSFLLDTKGSLMYGNPWQDNGDGSFTSLKGRRYYSPLDLYLMGLLDKSEVPPIMLIDSPGTDHTQISKPYVTISGTSRSVTIDEIVAANGERFPDASLSQKNFKIGCVFATRPGTFSVEALSPLRTILNNWAVWHSGLTDGRSVVVFQDDPLASLPFNPGPTVPPHTPRPTPAEVVEAVAWLMDHQSGDGSWADTQNTTQKDTAAALRALKPFAQAESNIAAALQWSGQNAAVAGTDYLARLIESLAVNQGATADLLSELVERQNDDGAWGPAGGYTSSPTDTALALRALIATGRLDAPQVVETMAYLTLKQNADGGWGGSPDSSDIQTTANVLIALAPLRVMHDLNQVVQGGLYWLYDKQQSDGGFGEEASSVYETAAALEVLKTYQGSAEQFSPAIDYLQGMQSLDGSWHSSAFETAVAAEALYAWKDSIDPDLAVMTSDITFAPETISQAPETIAIDVMVHNNGLTQAESFYVDLYEDTTAPESRVDRQSLSLAGQSSAAVQFSVTYSDTRDHRLFVLVDPDNAVNETSETNNVALAILANDLNTDPDLTVNTENMYFTPAGISQMPVDITLEALVSNTGLTEVPSATFALYQDIVTDNTKIGEQQIPLAAQSSVSLFFTFTVTDGADHRYHLIADPADQVPERNEYNNAAVKLLTSNPAYDFGFRAGDLSLSATQAEMEQPVTITALVRNFGNRDGFDVPARFYVEQDGVEYDIATLTFDLPAGTQVQQQVVWTADRPGIDMQVGVRVDPLNAFAEVSEINNSLSTPVTVNPYPDPNLRLTYEDISITPSPALEGQSVTIAAQISNSGGGQAEAVQVDFAWHRPGEPEQFLGSQTLETIAPGQTVQATWAMDHVDVSGLTFFTVTVDPQNAIQEVKEDDNHAFVEMEILSLPDFVIQAGSISFDPWAPADGQPVTVTVTVQNTGGQAGQNVPVALFEDGNQIADGVIASVPGNSQGALSFVYDTTGKSGTHYLEAVVNPDQTIAEQQTGNNTAGRTLGIQNSDLWLSQSHISANGGQDQAATTLFFHLDQATDVVVVVVDQDGGIVRTFDGEELTQTTGASITWDGRDARGALVPDGDYQIQVRDLLGNILLSMPVTVDNNLSPLAEAAGTDFMSVTNITCFLPEFERWQWFADESGIIFEIRDEDEDTPGYPPGVYTMSPNGSDIRLIVPWEWVNGRDPEYDYLFEGFALSPDDSTVAVVVYKMERNGDGRFYELWSMERDGNNLALIDTAVSMQSDGTGIGDSIRGYNISWSPDSAWLAYVVGNGNMDTWGEGLRLTTQDGAQKVSLPFASERSLFNINWSPDSSQVVYAKWDSDYRQETYALGDLTGQARDMYALPAQEFSNIATWFDATHFLLSHFDSQLGRDVIMALETLTPQQVTPLDVLADGQEVLDLQIHPAGEGFALLSDTTLWGGGDALAQYCDINGQCETLQLSRKIGFRPGLSDLSWSPLGDRLAFYDAFYEQVADCEYAGRIVVTDWPSRQAAGFPAAYPVQPDCGGGLPTSFHIWMQQDGLWVEQAVLHYGADLETKTAALPNLAPDDQGRAVLRITQVGTDAAHVDAVALLADGEAYAPSAAANLSSGLV